MSDTAWEFGPFRLDRKRGLTRGDLEVHVTPRSLAVLALLVERAGDIVTKEELFNLVWHDAPVTDSALSSCIRELRLALGDDARAPHFIRTVHRRGFRLLPDVVTSINGRPNGSFSDNTRRSLPCRATEMQRLQERLDRMGEGLMQTAILTGRDGSGKTALIHHFLTALDSELSERVCCVGGVEPGSTNSAYGPVLEILSQLSTGVSGLETMTALRRSAPSWLAEMTGMLSDLEQLELRQRYAGVTTQRRHRELVMALSEIAKTRPLILVIEDVDCRDVATLDWLSWVVSQPPAANMLLIVSLSPPGEGASASPTSQALEALLSAGAGSVIELHPLDLQGVAACISQQTSLVHEAGVSAAAAQALLRCSGGHPLLVAEILARIGNASERWQARADRVLQHGETLQQTEPLIRERIFRLAAEDRLLLEAAAVAGRRFTAAEIAAATGGPPDELALEALGAKTGWLQPSMEIRWPDGTSTRLFDFCNETVRLAVCETVPDQQQTTLHLRIARRLVAAWGKNSQEIAARLAAHFERAGDRLNAVKYLNEAGITARRLAATAVALENFRNARSLLRHLPRSDRQDRLEAELCTAVGREYVLREGLDSAQGVEMYQRAWELHRRKNVDPEGTRVLWRLWVFHVNRGPLATARQIALNLQAIARESGDPALQLEAHHALWGISLMEGQVNAVLEHTTAGMALCGSHSDGSLALTSGCTLHDVHLSDHHAATCAGFFTAWADMLAGRKEAAVRSVETAVSHARDVRHPFTLSVTLVMGAGALAAGGDSELAQLCAEEGMRIAEDEGFAALQAWASVYQGWAMTAQGESHRGLNQLRQGLHAGRQSGMTIFRPLQLSLAADAELSCGLVEDAAGSIAEGLAVAERVGDRLASAELHRLRAEVSMSGRCGPDALRSAETDLVEAQKTAEAQGAFLIAERVESSFEKLLAMPT